MPPSTAADWEPYPTDPPSAVQLVIRRRVLSPVLRNFRDLVVALPPSYLDSDRRYPVVYMQDGQNLFDPATSFAGDWHLRDTLDELGHEGIEAIVVGISNIGSQRLYEYSPFRNRRLGGGGGDRYLAFVADTVKPMIDRTFRTIPDRRHTTIAGSSMGGLISLYALYRYPDLFGAAGALSPSIWFARAELFRFLERHANLDVGRLYLDIGLGEPAGAVADVRAARDLLVRSGLRPGSRLEYLEAPGGTHNEEAWGARVSRALPFLLGLPSDPDGLGQGFGR